MAHSFTNPANAGFLRDSANLAIIVLSDEDDCSVLDAAGFFDPNNPALPPLDDFRCTAQGVVCDQPIETDGDKTNCRPTESSSYVSGIQPFVDAVRAIKPAGRVVSVDAVLGDPSPFRVEHLDATTPHLDNACTFQNDPQFDAAAPVVRTRAWAEALGGSVASICQQDMSATGHAIAAHIQSIVDGQQCITADVDRDTCTVFDVLDDVQTSLPRCPADGDCFVFASNGSCPLEVVVERVTPPAPGTRVQVFCT